MIELLHEIDSDLLISINCYKKPYTEELTTDKVINLTGESGSGKSYYSSRYINDDNYIVIDTDIIFGNRPKEDTITDFDNCYLEILDYFKDSNKTIVIDSTQFRNMKNYSLLKGKVIIMRTCIDTCYKRCINRCKNIINNNYFQEELEQYIKKCINGIKA